MTESENPHTRGSHRMHLLDDLGGPYTFMCPTSKHVYKVLGQFQRPPVGKYSVRGSDCNFIGVCLGNLQRVLWNCRCVLADMVN